MCDNPLSKRFFVSTLAIVAVLLLFVSGCGTCDNSTVEGRQSAGEARSEVKLPQAKSEALVSSGSQQFDTHASKRGPGMIAGGLGGNGDGGRDDFGAVIRCPGA